MFGDMYGDMTIGVALGLGRSAGVGADSLDQERR
jgi:hypothetical protein